MLLQIMIEDAFDANNNYHKVNNDKGNYFNKNRFTWIAECEGKYWG